MKNSACGKRGDSGAPSYVGGKAYGGLSAGSNVDNNTCQASTLRSTAAPRTTRLA